MDYMLSAVQAYKAFVIYTLTPIHSITEAVNFHGLVMNIKLFNNFLN